MFVELESRGPAYTLFFEVLQRKPWPPISCSFKMAFPPVLL